MGADAVRSGRTGPCVMGIWGPPILGTLGPHHYLDLGTPSLNLHRYGDPHPHIYGRFGDPAYINWGPHNYLDWGPRPQIYIDMGTPIPIPMVDMRTPTYLKCSIVMQYCYTVLGGYTCI